MIGFISSLFGVGGGVIAVPLLFFLFPHFPPQTIIGCSLCSISLNSLINLRNFFHHGIRPNPRILVPILIFSALGVWGGDCSVVFTGLGD